MQIHTGDCGQLTAEGEIPFVPEIPRRLLILYSPAVGVYLSTYSSIVWPFENPCWRSVDCEQKRMLITCTENDSGRNNTG